MAWIRTGIIGLVFVLVPACTPQAEVELETDDQKTIYAGSNEIMKVIIARRLGLE